jgi:shikimate 5-dehydrogenase
MFAGRVLGLPVVPLTSFRPDRFAVLVNATSVHDELPFAVHDLEPGTVVLDYVYRDHETALMAACRRRGLTIVDGWEILSREVRRQFHLMTGQPMPDPDPAPYADHGRRHPEDER